MPLALDKRHSFSISICDKSVWMRLLPYALPIIVPSGSPAVLHTLILMKSIVNKSPTISCIDCSAEKGITNNMFYLLKVLPQLKRYYKYLDQGPRTFVFYTLKQRLLTPYEFSTRLGENTPNELFDSFIFHLNKSTKPFKKFFSGPISIIDGGFRLPI